MADSFEDDPSGKRASQRERARELRREAYQRAKEARAKNPKIVAMKAAAKLQRKELYRKVKEQRKAAAAEAKRRKEAQRAEARAATDKELMKLVRTMSKGSDAQN